MKTKLIIAGLAAVLGMAALEVTGCKPSPSENASQTAPDSNTNKTASAPNTGTHQAAAETKPAQVGQYTCTMHPEVVQDKPGNCPICGMKLVIKK